MFKTPDGKERGRGRDEKSRFPLARGSEFRSCISSNEFLFDPEVANGPCRRANMPVPPFPFRRRGSSGTESRRGIGETVKNALSLAYKKKTPEAGGFIRIRSYVYQVKRAAVFTHSSYPLRYPPSLPALATHPSPDFILCFASAHPRSLHGHRSRAYATLKSLRIESSCFRAD